MKLFKITLNNVGYDTYDGCVVAAKSEKQARQLLNDYNWLSEQQAKTGYSFFQENDQTDTFEEIRIEELKEPTLLMSSFHAG